MINKVIADKLKFLILKQLREKLVLSHNNLKYTFN